MFSVGWYNWGKKKVSIYPDYQYVSIYSATHNGWNWKFHNKQYITISEIWMNDGVLSHNSTMCGGIKLGTIWVNEMNFGLNHAPGAGLIATCWPAVQYATTVLRLSPIRVQILPLCLQTLNSTSEWIIRSFTAPSFWPQTASTYSAIRLTFLTWRERARKSNDDRFMENILG